jgi:hypothetical protein
MDRWGWLAGLSLVALLAACGDHESRGRGEDVDNDDVPGGTTTGGSPGGWYDRDGNPTTVTPAPSTPPTMPAPAGTPYEEPVAPYDGGVAPGTGGSGTGGSGSGSGGTGGTTPNR